MATATLPQQKTSQQTRLLTLVACALILFLAATLSTHMKGLRVFGTFWSIGYNLAHHQNPYAPGPLSWHSYSRNGVTVVDVNSYAPVMLPLFSLLGRFNPYAACRMWLYLDAAAFLLCLLLLRGRWYHALWFVLSGPVLDSFLTTQIYPFLALLFVAAWLLLKANKQVAAGILIGFLVLLKPNFGLWPLFLFFTTYRKSSLYAAASCAFFGLIALPFYGTDVYAEWLVSMFKLSGDNHYIFPSNVSFEAMGLSLGHVHIGQLIALALIGISLYLVIRRPTLLNASGLALSLGILASPVGWIDYAIFLAPMLFVPWSKKFAFAMLLLSMPVFIALIALGGSYSPLLARCIYTLPILAIWGKYANVAQMFRQQAVLD